MKSIVSTLLSISMAILVVANPVQPQGKQAQDGDLLREKIELLEKTDIKTKSATVQLIYKRSLLRLYHQYLSALGQDITDLNNIKAATGDTNQDTQTEVAAQIRKLVIERDITTEKMQTLRDELQTSVASNERVQKLAPVAPEAPASSSDYVPTSYMQTNNSRSNTYNGTPLVLTLAPPRP